MKGFAEYAAIGTMDQRITIQRAVTADDGMGGQTTTWTDLVATDAKVTPLTLSERERLAALQVTAIQSYRVTCRYHPGWTPKDRVRWRTKTLQIHTVTDEMSGQRRTILEVTEIQ